MRIAVFFGLIVSLVAAPASAVQLALQGRLEPLSIAGVVANAAGDTGFSVGFRTGTFVLRGTLSFQTLSLTDHDRDSDANSNFEAKDRDSWFVLTPGIQAQLYFTEPASQEVVPFVSAKLAKGFAFYDEDYSYRNCINDVCTSGPTSTDPTDDFYRQLSEERDKMEQSLLSPWIVVVGGGLEYFPVDSVSIGMEVGLRFLISAGTVDVEVADQVEYEKQTILGLHLFYGVFTLNYFW